MERNEPSFVPEWYKGSSNTSAGNNHQSNISLHSDERSINFSPRSRVLASISDYDVSRTLSAPERTSFLFQRKTSSNGYNEHDKDSVFSTHLSFSRNYHDKDRDREKNLKIYDDGLDNHSNVSISSKFEKDSLRRTQSTLPEKRTDSWLKSSGHDSITGRISGINKSSFDREFPLLRSDERPSLCLNTAIRKIPVSSPVIIGGDGWTSVLAEVPNVGDNGLLVSSSLLQNNMSGLNMAETVAQNPTRVRIAPQLPGGNSQKIEEFQRQQILKLRPVKPSISKNNSVNTTENSKSKGSKISEHIISKVAGAPVSSQLANNNIRSNINFDASKTPQTGNFRILNRDKNGAYPTSVPPTAVSHLKGQHIPNFNPNGMDAVMTSSAFGEKKLPSQTQNRNDFFNSLRKKATSSQGNTNRDLNFNHTEVPDLMKSNEEIKDHKHGSLLLTNLHGCKVVDEPQKPSIDEEEVAFLRSLGWEENAGEDALTPEEIESFLLEYENRMPASKLKISGSLSKPSSSEAEAHVKDASLY